MVAYSRVAFDRQLDDVQFKVLQLSEIVAGAIRSSMDALKRRDTARAELIDAADARINALRFHIEEEIYALVALQQPNSRDMRFLMACVSMATDLERMGDYAAGMCRLVIRMQDKPDIEIPAELGQMVNIGLTMLEQAMTALETRDQTGVLLIADEETSVDTLYRQSYEKLLHHMSADAHNIEVATFLLWIAHNLERIADRVTNISERIVYALTGELKEYPRHVS
jgi:phosphate transport system protein